MHSRRLWNWGRRKTGKGFLFLYSTIDFESPSKLGRTFLTSCLYILIKTIHTTGNKQNKSFLRLQIKNLQRFKVPQNLITKDANQPRVPANSWTILIKVWSGHSLRLYRWGLTIKRDRAYRGSVLLIVWECMLGLN